MQIVAFTATMNATTRVAYRLNVLVCTRRLALWLVMGRNQYGHHTVAAFSSLAYLPAEPAFPCGDDNNNSTNCTNSTSTNTNTNTNTSGFGL